MQIATDRSKISPVMVTGATGYVAGWLVKRLLEQGLTVHAPVRDPQGAQAAALIRMAERLPGTLSLFRADLLLDGSYDVAMQGCAVVFHTASPFRSDSQDPQRDLIDPALKGTRNVLGSVNRSPTVRRVVLTGSVAAMFGDQADLRDIPGGVLTEAYWNTSSSRAHQPYAYSKTLAEGAAWEMANAQGRWDLVVVNPGLVVGPGVAGPHGSESFDLIRQLGDGTFRSGVPAYEIGMVDVRDVAQAHLRAGFEPDAEGRHMVFEDVYRFLDIARALKAEFPDCPAPERVLPKALLWLVGPMVSRRITRKTVARCFGHSWRGDNGKSKRALGMTYRPVPEAAAAMFRQMIEARVVWR
ncbi:NAD-dependent epimerase/dehydratase family protein [Thalassobius sp. S69A]|uniref:NAD-dependent epimerase/dehydratase family protein n=1 Tax=unclassified Thalassovita TaxID=2619711 RepID=UPI000C1047C6|nr:diaminohydroxyphosphoribosylaminopyrimidine deaminase [Paracoccaceae bacterium]MBT26041.1 diaminohydroxyphosphoribosylaminopyrimidine deaminase [Paracoccaceae bacterium]